MKNINIINGDTFLEGLKSIHCGEKHIFQISKKDFEIKQETTTPLEGYESPIGFPNCCKGHEQILQIGIDSFKTFPDCCDGHRKLHDAKWFKKENYAYLPEKLVTTVAYTLHCLSVNMESDDWYKKITDYIEYTKASYGQFPDGYGPPLGLELYLYNVRKNIEPEKEIPDEKKQKLISFIKKYHEPVRELEQIDLNLLISKYKEWLKIFPFELSFLNHLKPYFERQTPIIKSRGETNIYSGLTEIKVTTKQELINFLNTTTLSIIKELNTHKLTQLELRDSSKELQLEVLVANRKIEIEDLDKSNWEDRKGYIKVLKNWLNGEKRFLKEVASFYKENERVDSITEAIIDGIKLLQKNDTNEDCIINIKENRANKESSFRNWFKNFFTARYPKSFITAEEEKGNGRIDLKITRKTFGEEIIEFKGWWNHDKTLAVHQICSYLTDFENKGSIFIINDRKTKDITNDYKELVTQSNTGYVEESWKEHQVSNTDFKYFETKHQLSVKTKTIFHFVFNVYSSNYLDRTPKAKL